MEEEILKILLAIVVGGLIGYEREYRNKSAGFRTMVFICVGATIFTIISSQVAEDLGGNPTRIAANIVSGVGFLGAGVIIRDGGRVAGLTTASIIWLVAGLGMSIGTGAYDVAAVGCIVVLIVLWVFPYLEAIIDSLQETRTYTITCALNYDKIGELHTTLRECGLKVKSYSFTKSGEQMESVWFTAGSHNNQRMAMEKLLQDPTIIAFDC